MLDKIVKYLSGEITEEEKLQLFEWKKSKENLNRFQKISNLWKLTEDNKNDYQPDLEKGLKRFLNRIHVENNRTIIRHVLFNKITYWAAASIIFIVSTFLIWNTYNSTIITKYYTNANQSIQFYLPDSSLVVLNENSELSFNTEFQKRQVNLKGEAFFEIVRDTLKPFSVEGEYSLVTVLGTSFNVHTSKKENSDQINVLSGKVSFADKKKNNVQVILEKGFSAEIKNHEITESAIQNYNFLFYKTHELNFTNIPLVELTETLEKSYHQEIEILNPEIKDVNVTTSFKDMDIEEIMSELELILNISIEQEDNKWKLKMNK